MVSNGFLNKISHIFSFNSHFIAQIRFEVIRTISLTIDSEIDKKGRTILINKGGDRKDPANYRPITCLPTITKMVTLAIHKRMRGWLFGSVERNILENEQRGVRSSQGCKEAVIDYLAFNLSRKKD